MAKVHITNIVVLDNPSSFLNPFQFELTFECIEELKEDLEWKMIYVGSAESEIHDQILDTIYVGPVPEGRHIFVFQADPPDVNRIPEQDVVGVTIVLLTCSYRGQEFVRVGYFINNDYADPELREMPPAKPQFEKLTRNILESKPRVTRFKINWDDVQQQQQQNGSTSTTQCDSPFGSESSHQLTSFATGTENSNNTMNNEILSADDNSTLNCLNKAQQQQQQQQSTNNGVMMMMDQHFNTNMDDDNQIMMSSDNTNNNNNNNNKTISSCDPRINENSNSLAMEC